MSFLIRKDYEPYLRDDLITCFTEENENNLLRAEKAAQDEIISYLISRYDTAAIFIETNAFEPAKNYIVGDLIHLIASDWAVGTAYAVNDLVAYPDKEGEVYIALNISTGSQPDIVPTDWALLGGYGDLFSCIQDTTGTELPTNTAYFAPGDIRSQLIIRHMIYHVLYHISHLISARNIADYIVADKNDSATYLMDAADPRKNINPVLPLKEQEDKKGLDISWGSKDKQQNDY